MLTSSLCLTKTFDFNHFVWMASEALMTQPSLRL